jgi:hypothetical protein
MTPAEQARETVEVWNRGWFKRVGHEEDDPGLCPNMIADLIARLTPVYERVQELQEDLDETRDAYGCAEWCDTDPEPHPNWRERAERAEVAQRELREEYRYRITKAQELQAGAEADVARLREALRPFATANYAMRPTMDDYRGAFAAFDATEPKRR